MKKIRNKQTDFWNTEWKKCKLRARSLSVTNQASQILLSTGLLRKKYYCNLPNNYNWKIIYSCSNVVNLPICFTVSCIFSFYTILNCKTHTIDSFVTYKILECTLRFLNFNQPKIQNQIFDILKYDRFVGFEMLDDRSLTTYYHI